jgi:hypothetical protein
MKKKDEKQIQKLINLTKIKLSTKSLKTFNEVLNFLGFSRTLDIDKGNILSTINLKKLFPIYTKGGPDFPINISDFVVLSQAIINYWTDVSPSNKPKLDVIETTPDAVTLDKHELDSLLPKYSEKQSCFLYNYQKRPTYECYIGIKEQNQRSQYLSAGTGTGKTIMYLQVLRWFFDQGFIEKNSVAPYPMMIITKSGVIQQTLAVAKDKFGFTTMDGLLVTSYDQLRSNFGKRFLAQKTRIVNGEPEQYFEWHDGIQPLIIVVDEGHAVKNIDSLQSQIIQALSKIKSKVFLIFTSATPYMRVVEAKAFALNAKVKYLPFEDGKITQDPKETRGIILDNEHWSNWANRISEPSAPEDYDHNAVARFTKAFDSYIKRAVNVHFQFKPKNSCKLVAFMNDWERDYYYKAEERFLKEKEEIEGKILDGTMSPLMRLAIMNKFREAAEFAKSFTMAKLLWEAVNSGKAGFCAVNNRPTIAKIVQILDQNYNIPRSKISLIWGGSDVYSGTNTKITKEDIKHAMSQAQMGEVDPNMFDKIRRQLLAQRAGLGDLPPEYRLGPQSRIERHNEKMKFQKGLTQICIFTLKAGGTGLDLHHTDDYTEEKVRRRPSGWAELEDIPNIPTLPRKGYITPTFSAPEFVQGLGRTARVTSLSSTEQDILFYGGTWEEYAYEVTTVKLKCLKEVIKYQEHWEDALYNPSKYKETITKGKELQQQEIDDDDTLSLGQDLDDEDENENGENNETK